MSAEIGLRPMEPEDRGFVVKSFLTSYGRSHYAAGVPGAVLVELLDPMLIVWPTTLAVAPDGELLGWVCGKDGNLAWVFVKPDFRGRGVARALLAHAGVGRQVTMPFAPTKGPGGKSFAAYVRGKGLTVHFRPYLPLVTVQELGKA